MEPLPGPAGAAAREEIAATELRIAAAVTTAQDHTIEAMRDMQSEILRGIEAFARFWSPPAALRVHTAFWEIKPVKS
jgi:4-hydroxybenzoate polyprenyltransferase